MKILMPSPLIYPCYTGGMEIFNFHFVSEAARRGNEVHLIARKGLQSIEKVKIYPLLSHNWRLDCFEIMCRAIRMSGTAVVHFPYSSNSRHVYAMNLSRKLSRALPYFAYIHGGGMHTWKDAAAQDAFFRGASHVAAVSKTIKKEYEKRLDREVEYIPPVIPFQMPSADRAALRSRFAFGPSDFVFVLVGSIKKIKGSDFFVDAVLSLERAFLERHGLRFVFIGDGPLKIELERKVASANLEERIIFKGLVPHEEVGTWLRAADAFLIPSQFEGTPIAMLEALFHGIPVIGSDTDGIADIIEDGRTGLLFKPLDGTALIKQIKTLVQFSEIRRTLGRAGKMLFDREYSFSRVMDRHLSILHAVAEFR
jgi:glycosyltransferase involved in cell wall biosynthesis